MTDDGTITGVVDPLRCSEPGGCDETSLGPVTSSDQDGGAGGGGP